MIKSVKYSIAAVVLVAAGFAAYQSYGSYGVQNNSLLMQNIEALAQNIDPDGDNGDDLSGLSSTALFSILQSGVCGYKCDKYEVTYEVNGGSSTVTLGWLGGRFVNNVGATVNYPNIIMTKKLTDTFRVETGKWQVCVRNISNNFFDTCDRCLQFNCIGTKDCDNNLAIPTNALLD